MRATSSSCCSCSSDCGGGGQHRAEEHPLMAQRTPQYRRPTGSGTGRMALGPVSYTHLTLPTICSV
eukprot:11686389-Alexandrium_andersonii.AAC.1